MALQGYLRLQCGPKNRLRSPVIVVGCRAFHLSRLVQSRHNREGKGPDTAVKSSATGSAQSPLSQDDSDSLISRKQLQTIQPTHLQPRRTEAPARIVPKPQVGQTISPKDRLRIEYSTRQPPKPVKKPVFKERLLIYHGGIAYNNYVSFLRVATIFAAAFGILIMAPAYYTYETAPGWTVPLILVVTVGPFFLVKFLARPFVSWIYLSLPTTAQQSPKAALEYSKNMPRNAMLQISFMRGTALMGQVEVSIADLVPRKGLWPPTTFESISKTFDKGDWYSRNPSYFFVNKRSGTGKAARDTVPDIWENVYRKIMKIER